MVVVKRDLAEKRLLRLHQDPEVAVLTPSAGTLDQFLICGEDTMRVSDGRVVRFPCLLRWGWGQEAANDGVI